MNIFQPLQKLLRKKKPLPWNESTFHPLKSLEGKNNYKRYFRIAQDGSAKERIFLNVPNISLREEIICKHYLQFLIRNFIREPVGGNFVSRDDPWDFGVELSNREIFNVEITSVADNKWLQEKMKREETFEALVTKEKIRLKELKKMYAWFDDEKLGPIIKNAEEQGLGLDELVENPFLNMNSRLYISDSKEEESSLTTIVLEAIERKNKKAHPEKEKTILIIDNRTSRFEMIDYQKAAEELEGELENIPFPEIYLYTGYYSNDDGSNAEYSFAPIKLPDDKRKLLQQRIDSRELIPNKDGIAYD